MSSEAKLDNFSSKRRARLHFRIELSVLRLILWRITTTAGYILQTLNKSGFCPARSFSRIHENGLVKLVLMCFRQSWPNIK